LPSKHKNYWKSFIQNNNKLYFSEFTKHKLLRSATQDKKEKDSKIACKNGT